MALVLGAAMVIAALFVQRGGVYAGLPDVDPWDEARDARRYAGPWPVVAHPPCERWGRLWYGGPTAPVRFELGDDGGCFEAALDAVRKWGGVLEHPEASLAWSYFGMITPPRSGGWVSAGLADPGWTCCVEQGHYGHRATKRTWLYACGVELPSLRWGPSARRLPPQARVFSRPPRGLTNEERAARRAWLAACAEQRGKVWACPEQMNKSERAATPIPFRDLLLSIARSARHPCERAHV